MKIIRTVIASILAAASFAAGSCEKTPEDIVYLEVKANNISGQWQLVEWNGVSLSDGTYVYLDLVRTDRTYVMYQNVNSFPHLPAIVTGSYHIENDPESGAVIRGIYDHDAGDWSHRYIITDLTATEMTWIAKDDETYVQKFARVDSIPVAEQE